MPSNGIQLSEVKGEAKIALFHKPSVLLTGLYLSELIMILVSYTNGKLGIARKEAKKAM